MLSLVSGYLLGNRYTFPGSIPGSRRSPGEGIGYPLQYSWASLVAQLVKNLPAMQETWVRSLGWKIPWRRHGNPLHYSCLENPRGQSLEGYGPWVQKEVNMTEPLSTPLDKMLGPRRHSPFLNKAPKQGLQGFQISLLTADFITNIMCRPRKTVFQWGNFFFP